MKKNKGFTLIELLVVIAIIGILASIVLVSLGGARTRAKDARVAADLGQIRTTAEIIFSATGDYNAVLANEDINNLINDMNNQGATNILRVGDANGYCVEATLPGGLWGCVNSGLTALFNLNANPPCSSGPPLDINCQ